MIATAFFCLVPRRRQAAALHGAFGTPLCGPHHHFYRDPFPGLLFSLQGREKHSIATVLIRCHETWLRILGMLER